MQGYDSKSVALSTAANLSVDGIATPHSLVTAAISFLSGKTDKATFFKKCGKNVLYARLVALARDNATEFDTDALCAVHKALYEPKAKCGELRTEELNINGGSCTDPKILRGSLKNALAKLCEIPGAPSQSKADFAAALVCYVRELIILSPFSYGNGVTRRAFIQGFCQSKGFSVTYAAVPKKDLETAENEAFGADDPQPLFTVFLKCLNYLQDNPAPPRASRAALTPKTARPAGELAASKRAPAHDKADALRELREVQKSLTALTQKVNEIIKNLEE